MLVLPPIPNPEKYAGLFVYDFGSHVAVGYTAKEVRMLMESRDHRNGQAYQIYRVGDAGEVELIGVRDERLAAHEALLFLSESAQDAKENFNRLRENANAHPVPCATELRLMELEGVRLPHAAALCYWATASTAVARWLSETGFDGGQEVVSGTDAYDQVTGHGKSVTGPVDLPMLAVYEDRSADEVFAAIDRPLQR